MARLSVIGIHGENIDSIDADAKKSLLAANLVFGPHRLAPLVIPLIGPDRWCRWATPIADSLDRIATAQGSVVVMANGNPMLYGIGNTLKRRFPRRKITIWPAPSAFSLACARLGWAQQDSVTISLHNRPHAHLRRVLSPGLRIIALTTNGLDPVAIAALLTAAGYGQSTMHVLENLACIGENHRSAIAREWQPSWPVSDLNVVAIRCVIDRQATPVPLGSGLPDHLFCHDGQLTKRDRRATGLAHLAPLPGHLLWDIGAGCGSMAIEWMRIGHNCRAIAIERDSKRAAIIRANADRFGVPDMTVIHGDAPARLADLERPDAVFIGGSVRDRRIWRIVRRRLRPGGRLVANAISRDGQSVLFEQHERHGGHLTLHQTSSLAPLMPMQRDRATPANDHPGHHPGHRPSMPENRDSSGDSNVVQSGDSNIAPNGDSSVAQSGDSNVVQSGDSSVVKSGTSSGDSSIAQSFAPSIAQSFAWRADYPLMAYCWTATKGDKA